VQPGFGNGTGSLPKARRPCCRLTVRKPGSIALGALNVTAEAEGLFDSIGKGTENISQCLTRRTTQAYYPGQKLALVWGQCAICARRRSCRRCLGWRNLSICSFHFSLPPMHPDYSHAGARLEESFVGRKEHSPPIHSRHSEAGVWRQRFQAKRSTTKCPGLRFCGAMSSR